MASIPENVRILWPSSATTPSGWATDTAFNDVMPYSANSGSGTGGSDNHNHNGNSHSHPGGSHTHSTSNMGSNCTQAPYYPPYGQYQHFNQTGPGRGACHVHPAASLGPATTGGSSGGNSNYGSGSSLSPYYTFRVIKSDGSGDGFPANSVVLWGTASNPTTESGWSQHGGSVGKFIRGASSGGSAVTPGSHSHNSTGNHTHSGGGGSHTHSAGTGATSNSLGAAQGGGCPEENCGEQVIGCHTHSVPSGNSGTASGTANAGNGGASAGATLEATYISVWGVTNSSDSWLEGGIGFISGEGVPEDWVLCNGSNSTPNLNASKYIKLSASGGAVSGTGGSSSHNHGSPGGHTHPGGGSHGHPLSSSSTGMHNYYAAGNGFGYGNQSTNWGGNQARKMVPNCHDHAYNSSTTNNAATGNYGSGTQGINSQSSIFPAYKTVTWIMAPEEPAAGGGNVGMFGANF